MATYVYNPYAVDDVPIPVQPGEETVDRFYGDAPAPIPVSSTTAPAGVSTENLVPGTTITPDTGSTTTATPAPAPAEPAPTEPVPTEPTPTEPTPDPYAALNALMAQAQSDPNSVIPAAAFQNVVSQLINQGELVQSGTGQIAAAPQAPAAETAQATQAAAAGDIPASLMEPAVVGTGAQMQAVQGDLSDRAIITDPVTGELRPESKAEAVVRQSPPEAFIRNQMSSLLTGMSGGEIPAWAQPAVDAAESRLAQRGMGKSSVARSELYNAIIQSALPIAQGDAATAQQTFLANLNNEQQAVMFNAAKQANMDMANLSAQQQAQVHNAQAFLQMDFANMNNAQQAAEINMQARQQAMLSDQAAQNAASKFNATSANQTQQFMASLNAQINDNNANRATRIAQFNTGETNAINRFNAELAFNRDKFNAANALAIEQSNVQWRRQVNTINTANQNAVNQAEAMNAFNLSNQALTFLWQEQRDNAQWAWQGAQNADERATRVTIAAMSNEAAANQVESEMWGEIGGAAVGIVGEWLLQE